MADTSEDLSEKKEDEVAISDDATSSESAEVELKMQCFSISKYSLENRNFLNTTNKMILPFRFLGMTNFSPYIGHTYDFPGCYHICNQKHFKFTHSFCYECSTYQDEIYVPSWIMKQLELAEGDEIKLTRVHLTKGTYIKFITENKEPKHIDLAKAAFQDQIASFPCLTTGDLIEISFRKSIIKCKVALTKPAYSIFVCKNIKVEFESAEEALQREKIELARKARNEKIEMAEKEKRAEYYAAIRNEPFSGQGRKLGRPGEVEIVVSPHDPTPVIMDLSGPPAKKPKGDDSSSGDPRFPGVGRSLR